MDQNRHAADSVGKYKLYFDMLQQKIKQYYVKAAHIYNIDKKGFLISITSRLKQVFSKALYRQKIIQEAV